MSDLLREQSLINIHTHKAGQGISIVDASLGEPEASGRNDIYFSMGIHPMYINAEVERGLAEIEDYAARKEIVAVGEAGLDRNSGVMMERQAELFGRQIGISEKYGLPMIVHCVRSFPELISLHKKYSPRQAWIIHGFNNRMEVLRELLRHGFYISAGKQVMNRQSNIYQFLPQIPLQQLFMETDDSDLDIGAVYAKVTERLGVTECELRERIYDNFVRLFKV